jgi:hypothetical protein
MAQDVQGCTDAEAEGDIRRMFTSSPAESQAEVYERLDARDIDALLLMIVIPDIESSETSIARRVLERTVTELCASQVR